MVIHLQQSDDKRKAEQGVMCDAQCDIDKTTGTEHKGGQHWRGTAKVRWVGGLKSVPQGQNMRYCGLGCKSKSLDAKEHCEGKACTRKGVSETLQKEERIPEERKDGQLEKRKEERVNEKMKVE